MARPKKTQRKHRKSFTPEAKAEAVARFKSGVPAKQVASELETSIGTVYNWAHDVHSHANQNPASIDRFDVAMACIQELNRLSTDEARLTMIKALERSYTEMPEGFHPLSFVLGAIAGSGLTFVCCAIAAVRRDHRMRGPRPQDWSSKVR